jgi:hypothetical protein
MPILEAIGIFVLTYAPITALDVNGYVNKANQSFSEQVDSRNSCWERVAGEVGTYGTWSNYNLDPRCEVKRRAEAKKRAAKEELNDKVNEKIDSIQESVDS